MLFEVFPSDDRVVVKNSTRAVDIHVLFPDFREARNARFNFWDGQCRLHQCDGDDAKNEEIDTSLEEEEKAERKHNAGVRNDTEGENLTSEFQPQRSTIEFGKTPIFRKSRFGKKQSSNGEKSGRCNDVGEVCGLSYRADDSVSQKGRNFTAEIEELREELNSPSPKRESAKSTNPNIETR